MLKALLIGLLIAALAGGVARPAAASCANLTADQQFAHAHVVFDAVALTGPTATGFERFHVLRYLKSSGPQLIQVSTGRAISMISSIAITPRPGEMWRIYAKRLANGLFDTNECLGSRRLLPASGEPPGQQWLPTLTIAGRSGIRSLTEDDRVTGKVASASVRRGELLRLRFNFQPLTVTIRHGRSPGKRLNPQQAVTWRVPASGSYVVRLTATWARKYGSETVQFTSRFSIRLTAHP